MKASKYIAKRLKEEVSHVFGITGGAVVNLFDAIHKEKIKLIPMHHEQAAAMAADAYSRFTGFGCAIGTSGPGITNLITGACCSWFDSNSVLLIGGQVPRKHLKGKLKVRQKGFQEVDSVKLFEPITKFAKRVDDVQLDLESAINISQSMRKGPAYLELCDDTQREQLKIKEVIVAPQKYPTPKKKDLETLEKLYTKAKRPVFIIGAGANNAVVRMALESIKIPFFLTWGAMDLFPHDHPLNMRDFGVTSQRVGNFAIKHADLVIALGTRLDTHQPVDTNGKLVVVDLDKEELKKHKADLKINTFSEEVAVKMMDFPKKEFKWIENIKRVREKYKMKMSDSKFIDPYVFFDKLSDAANEGAIIVTDAGQNLTWTMQSWKVKDGQTLFSAFNNSPMGYSLPAAIGAHYATGKEVICIIGEGGLMINLQELQTIVGNNLPIKIFLIDNGGYGMIKQTLSDWDTLKDNVAVGEPDLTFPDFERLCDGFRLDYFELNKKDELAYLEKLLSQYDPFLCRVEIKNNSKILNKLKFGDKLTDLTPKLSNKQKKEVEQILCQN